MGKRLNQDRQARLEPSRMEKAVTEITGLGYEIFYQDTTTLQFIHNGTCVTYYPYSGWATGKSIRDGRGLNHLLKQIR